MDISITIIKLIIFATPGTISLFIYQKLTGQHPKNDLQSIISLTVLSVPNYILSGLILDQSPFKLLELFLSNPKEIPWIGLITATLTSAALPFLYASINKYKIINKIGQKIKATNRFGDEDLWEFFQNGKAKTEQNKWLFIRDLRVNLCYYGWIEHFSESNQDRELIISDVTVYDNINGTELYATKSLYICRNKFEITIEIPIIPNEKNKENKNAKTHSN